MPAHNCHTTDDVKKINCCIAADLDALNIDVNCTPVMDLLFEETHDIIGDRAFSDNPQEVFEKAEAVCQAHLEAGITPVAKHIPGHGRATADSHLELPVVETSLAELEQTDFEPFRLMAESPLADQVWGMVAHIIYTAIDPDLCLTVSKGGMNYLRKELKIDHFLLPDDISMLALEKYGNLADRAVKTLEAGADATLYCAGKQTEMEEVMAVVPPMTDESFNRYERSTVRRRSAA
jgi:beta-N-acetylhexosaminidase